jgi:hypothetical protein
MAAGTGNLPSAPVLDRLKANWANHRDALLKALEARMNERAEGRDKELTEKAEQDVAELRAVLIELKAQIEAAFVQKPQLEMFENAEQAQIRLNHDSLQTRAEAIPQEIEQETHAIRSRYANRTPRLFPVSVTYLVPENLSR